jgi:fibronectin type 3 domain-containing protein
LNRDLVVDASYDDATATSGHRYVYTVRAVDRAGNQSPPSPEAKAEPF